ncbi:MAG: hypothetical protein EBU54_13135, partial [Mycobacteriaceae bacterium]|nr:hypothetical protein [Mycobacteriaceae bacterium]
MSNEELFENPAAGDIPPGTFAPQLGLSMSPKIVDIDDRLFVTCVVVDKVLVANCKVTMPAKSKKHLNLLGVDVLSASFQPIDQALDDAAASGVRKPAPEASIHACKVSVEGKNVILENPTDKIVVIEFVGTKSIERGNEPLGVAVTMTAVFEAPGGEPVQALSGAPVRAPGSPEETRYFPAGDTPPIQATANWPVAVQCGNFDDLLFGYRPVGDWDGDEFIYNKEPSYGNRIVLSVPATVLSARKGAGAALSAEPGLKTVPDTLLVDASQSMALVLTYRDLITRWIEILQHFPPSRHVIPSDLYESRRTGNSSDAFVASKPLNKKGISRFQAICHLLYMLLTMNPNKSVCIRFYDKELRNEKIIFAPGDAALGTPAEQLESVMSKLVKIKPSGETNLNAAVRQLCAECPGSQITVFTDGSPDEYARLTEKDLQFLRDKRLSAVVIGDESIIDNQQLFGLFGPNYIVVDQSRILGGPTMLFLERLDKRATAYEAHLQLVNSHGSIEDRDVTFWGYCASVYCAQPVNGKVTAVRVVAASGAEEIELPVVHAGDLDSNMLIIGINGGAAPTIGRHGWQLSPQEVFEQKIAPQFHSDYCGIESFGNPRGFGDDDEFDVNDACRGGSPSPTFGVLLQAPAPAPARPIVEVPIFDMTTFSEAPADGLAKFRRFDQSKALLAGLSPEQAQAIFALAAIKAALDACAPADRASYARLFARVDEWARARA